MIFTPETMPKVGTTAMAIDNHMTSIQVQVGKNIIENVLLNGGLLNKHNREVTVQQVRVA